MAQKKSRLFEFVMLDRNDDFNKLFDLDFKYLVFGFDNDKILGYIYYSNARSIVNIRKQVNCSLYISEIKLPEAYKVIAKTCTDLYEFGNLPFQGSDPKNHLKQKIKLHKKILKEIKSQLPK